MVVVSDATGGRALRLMTCFFFGGLADGAAAAGVGATRGHDFGTQVFGVAVAGGAGVVMTAAAPGEEVSARAPPLLHGDGFRHVADSGGGRSVGRLGNRWMRWREDITSDRREVGEIHAVDPGWGDDEDCLPDLSRCTS
jgi:hypothetical protein